jgi:hypothetical protein
LTRPELPRVPTWFAAIRIGGDADARLAGAVDDQAMTATTLRLCRIAAAAGRDDACPERACPFWEPGGAALDGRCAVDRLDLDARADVVSWLLRLRERLEAAATTEDADRARRVLYALIDTGDADGG